VPLTVQTAGVAELKVTASPELAVAAAVAVPPTVNVAGVNVMTPMVWLVLFTVMLPVTSVAAV
jgi:hypothetical protein